MVLPLPRSCGIKDRVQPYQFWRSLRIHVRKQKLSRWDLIAILPSHSNSIVSWKKSRNLWNPSRPINSPDAKRENNRSAAACESDLTQPDCSSNMWHDFYYFLSTT